MSTVATEAFSRPPVPESDLRGLVGVLLLIFVLATTYTVMFLGPDKAHGFRPAPACHCRCCQRGAGQAGAIGEVDHP